MADASQMKNAFSQIPPGKRFAALAIGAVTLGLMIALIAWSQKPTFQVLFSGLTNEDAGKIVEKLRTSKVPYKLDSGGSTILVPAEKVYDTRLAIAGEGLLSGGTVGFEIFDTPKLGMTDFVQTLNYQRAIQGELSRTIQAMAGVEKARVHIVIPKRSVFSEREELPSASVVVSLKSGRGLPEGQVAAISQLISGSVPGLSPDRVSVIDNKGLLLSKAKTGSGEDGGTAEAVTAQRSIESDLSERARAILEKTVGQGRVVVRISANVEQKRMESTEEKYDPDTVVVRSEQRVQERATGASSTPSGVPGTPSNTPSGSGAPATAAAVGGAGTPSNSQKTNETINYEISRTISKTSSPITTIKRITVAVLVDGSYKTVKDDKGEETSTYVARTTEELAGYDRLVKNAVGFDTTRGDSVEIVSAPFQISDAPIATAEKAPMALPTLPPTYVPIAQYIAAIILVLMLILFVVRPLMSSIFAPAQMPVTASGEYVSTASLVADRASAGEIAGAGSRPALPPSLQEDVSSLAQREPQRAAQAIKLWLVQG